VSDDTSGTDFDDEEDPDKIEVPGKLRFIQIIFLFSYTIIIYIAKIIILHKIMQLLLYKYIMM